MKTIISCTSLQTQLDNPECLIFDCRFSLMDFSAGQRHYNEAHIPGAIYASLNEDLSATHQAGITGRHPLPDKDSWSTKVNNWGIKPSTQVVIYDDAGGFMAARMWWMLGWLGHDNAMVLDGGWQTWTNANFPATQQRPEPLTASTFDYGSLPARQQVIEASQLNSQRQLILDARALPRFKGEMEPIDPIAGHIPGAQCSPCENNLDQSGLLKSKQALQQKFSMLENNELDVVSYCGSGVTAAHNILAMTHAGFSNIKLYAGSWSEWITDPSHEIAVGD